MGTEAKNAGMSTRSKRLVVCSIVCITILIATLPIEVAKVHPKPVLLTSMNVPDSKSTVTADPIKVLVIDWMSDPLLSYLDILVNASFDTSLGSWLAGDTNLLNWLDYWDVTSYRKYSGSGSAWCAQVGSKGIPPFDTPNKDTHTYDDDMDAFFQTTISLFHRRSANLTYYYWIKTEQNYDWLAVEVSENAGITWTTLANYTYGDSGGWKYATLSLDSFAGKILVTIRFRFHSNGTNHDYEGAYIDEVKLIASPAPYMDNSIERAFWENINSDPNFNVTVKPPVVLDFSLDRLLQVPEKGLSALVSKDIRNYIQELQPDVIVLDDLSLDMFDLWGLNKTERLGLFDYVEQGHGLILTYGSFFDMRVNTTYVGSYGHVNRLYLEQKPSLEDLRNNYRSSLAAASGLGLFPIYEEVREQIANFIAGLGEEGKAIAFTLRSAPLLPVGVPFNDTFTAENASDPILQGIGGSFTIALDSKGINANGTLVGWQLEYPFLMASRAINKTKLLLDKIRPVIRDMAYQIIANVTSKISDFVPGYSFPNVLIDTSELDAIIDNSTTTMMNFLMSLYEARLKTPTEITIPIHFMIGNFTVDTNITIPIPVEIQEIVKPATIVAESADELAAILRYEVGNHRAVYFTFKPSLETSPSGPCEQLMKNAISWASKPPTPKPMTVISNLGVPFELVNTIRKQLGQPDVAVTKWNGSDVINEKRTYLYALDLNKADSVVAYWYGDPANVTLTLGDTTYMAANVTVAGAHGAFIGYVSTEGTWTLSIKLKNDDPLLTPVAIEIYPSYDSTSPFINTPSQDPPEDLQPDQVVTVSVNVTDAESGVREVILSYSTDGGATWTNVTMSGANGDTYVGQIPGFPAGTNVQYKVVAYDNAGNFAVNDKAGQYWVYTVIPEFPTCLSLLLVLLVLTLVIVLVKKKITHEKRDAEVKLG